MCVDVETGTFHLVVARGIDMDSRMNISIARTESHAYFWLSLLENESENEKRMPKKGIFVLPHHAVGSIVDFISFGILLLLLGVFEHHQIM